MYNFSEFVSLGHPDKIADYISSYLLDRYIEQDPETRYAVEVQIKDYQVTLGGEVASKAIFSKDEITEHVKNAVREIGYDWQYRKTWGDKAVCAELLKVTALISQQSKDIAAGVDNGGWGDQGIFFGMATPDRKYHFMPADHAIAKNICKELFESGIGGLDIKTQVETKNGKPEHIVVAIPLLKEMATPETKAAIEAIIQKHAGSTKNTINGTGIYEQHSSIADCGTTGRKLVVDFYGGNCPIGGGSPWTKDGSKADLTLNLHARAMAIQYARRTGVTCFVKLACCIGQHSILWEVTTAKGELVAYGTGRLRSNLLLRERYGLDKPIYADMCRWGLFGEWQMDKKWENAD